MGRVHQPGENEFRLFLEIGRDVDIVIGFETAINAERTGQRGVARGIGILAGSGSGCSDCGEDYGDQNESRPLLTQIAHLPVRITLRPERRAPRAACA